MKLILEDESISANSMRNCHKIMLDIFGDDVELVDYWGPVQMCVFYLEYKYSPDDYKIIMECERGFIVIEVQDKVGNVFWPFMIFPQANYFHYADVEKDVLQLVELTHKAIKENLIIFEPSGTTKYSDSTCLHCFDVREVHNFISPERYEETIKYIKELIEKENFILVEGNCPIGEHKKDGHWIDDIIYHVIKCPKCGWKFTCIVNTYRGSGSFTRER